MDYAKTAMAGIKSEPTDSWLGMLTTMRYLLSLCPDYNNTMKDALLPVHLVLRQSKTINSNKNL